MAGAGSDAIRIPYESYTLPNGLTVILSVDHTTPTVAVNVWYHVGSKNELPGRTGFAGNYDVTRIREEIGYRPEWPLEKGVEAVIRAVQAKGRGERKRIP